MAKLRIAILASGTGSNALNIIDYFKFHPKVEIAFLLSNKKDAPVVQSAKKKEINDPHIKDLVIKTTIQDNQLTVIPFEMKISGFDAEVEGTNDISGAINYIVKLQLLPIDKLKIPFHVTGTYDDPKVALGKGHKLPD